MFQNFLKNSTKSNNIIYEKCYYNIASERAIFFTFNFFVENHIKIIIIENTILTKYNTIKFINISKNIKRFVMFGCAYIYYL